MPLLCVAMPFHLFKFANRDKKCYIEIMTSVTSVLLVKHVQVKLILETVHKYHVIVLVKIFL